MSPRYPYDPPDPTHEPSYTSEASASEASVPSSSPPMSPPPDPAMAFYGGSLAEEAQYRRPASSEESRKEQPFEASESESHLSEEVEALRRMGGGRSPSSPRQALYSIPQEAYEPSGGSRRRKAKGLPSGGEGSPHETFATFAKNWQAREAGEEYEPPVYDPGPSAEEDKVSIASVFVSLSFVGLAMGFLFFGGSSLHAKFHYFTLFLFVFLVVYNWRAYVSPEEGFSALDSYVIVTTDEEGMQTEVGRGGKWWRLVFSLREALRPDVHIDGQPDTDMESFSWRVFLEWIILFVGCFWCWVTAYQYYWRPDGPYLHDLMGVYLATLFFATIPWAIGWIRRRFFQGGQGLRQHIEALNFLLWRWLMCYLLMWLVAFFVMLDD